jgi:hypothetical protein
MAVGVAQPALAQCFFDSMFLLWDCAAKLLKPVFTIPNCVSPFHASDMFSVFRFFGLRIAEGA